jgi:hypothetical protein
MSETHSPASLENLQGLLQNHLRGRLRNVRVVQREGQVVMQGIAVNWYAKQLALHLARNTLATAPLVNEIEVR